MTIPILTKSYEAVIAQETCPVVIEFFATWCPKCSMMAPVFERIARELSPKIKFYKMDIDISEKEAEKLGIEIVPTFLIFNNGQIKGYTVGVLSEPILKSRILESINR